MEFLIALTAALGTGLLVFGWLHAKQESDDSLKGRFRALLQEKAQGTVSDADFQHRQTSLQADLLQTQESPAWPHYVGWGVGTVSLLVCAYLIFQAGNHPSDVAPNPQAHANAPIPPGMPSSKTNAGNLDVLVIGLAEKMQKDPGNGQGWALLARTYMQIGRPAQAVEAFDKAVALLPNDAKLRDEAAQARATQKAQAMGTATKPTQ